MSKQRIKQKKGSALSTELILTTALRLAEDAGGLQNLSLRQLGKALDIDPTAVYRYFRSKDELVAAMGERILSEMLPNEEELEGDWRVRLTAMAHRSRRVFIAYPLLTIDLSSLQAETPTSDRLVEVGYLALSDAGLSDEYVVQFYELLYIFTLGMGMADAPFGADPEAGRAGLRDRYATLSTEDFPTIRRLAPLGFPDGDTVFQLGLAVYLNSIEFYANSTTE